MCPPRALGALVRRREADRRSRPRFEIVGELWGTVETLLRLPLRDLGLNGALVESHVPLAVGSVHRILWDAEGGETSTEVRVCHVRQETGADGEETYLVGVEFVTPHPLVRQQIHRWLVEASSPSNASGA